MRPHQWTKNLLVFAAPVAAGAMNNGEAILSSSTAFVGFSFVASSMYIGNDVADRKSDRQHPVKKYRPLAAGEILPGLALLLGSTLLFAGVLLTGLSLGWRGIAVTALYVVLTLAYSFRLKHVPVIEMMIVSSGFIFRAVLGTFVAGAEPSRWFILCVSFGALFVVAGKRYAEFVELGDQAQESRPSLGVYTAEYLRTVLTVSMAVSILTYCLWAFESDVASGSMWFVISIVPVAGVFLRYLLVLDSGGGAAPEEVFWRDRPIQFLGLVWLVVYLVAVYS